jgi:large subunit ribosomal protein L16
MLTPKRVKHRKQHRGHRRGVASGGTSVAFGDYGLQALEPSWVTNRQIEAARIAMAVVRPGRVMFELSGVPEATAQEAMRLAAHKLPMKCRFVKRADAE